MLLLGLFAFFTFVTTCTACWKNIVLRREVFKLKQEKREIEDAHSRLKYVADHNSNLQRITTMRISAAEAQFYASMIDGGYAELCELRTDNLDLRRKNMDLDRERRGALGAYEELKTLATLSAMTSGRQNASPKLVSAIALTLTGKMSMSEFGTAVTIERDAAVTDENGRKQLTAAGVSPTDLNRLMHP